MDSVRSLDWFSHMFISHAIPEELKSLVTTVDLDWTPIKAHEWCRAFGLAAHTIGVLALAIAHNLKQTFRVERTQTQKPTTPARPKSHHPTRRNILADSLSAQDSTFAKRRRLVTD